MNELAKIFSDHALPFIVAAFADNKKDADIALKINELCVKHGVSFTAYMNILQEYSEWEANYHGRD